MNKATRIFASAFVIAGLVACTPTPTSSADAVLQYCKTLIAYEAAVANLNSLGASATVGQYKEATKAVAAAYESVVASAKDVGAAKTDAIKTAQEDLQRTVNGISDSTPMAQAVATVAPKVKAVQDSVAQAQTTVKCS